MTSVEGDTINFDIERARRVRPPSRARPLPPPTPAPTSPRATRPTVAGATVAQSVLDQLVSNGKQVNQVSCPDLAARVGASKRCTLMSGLENYGVTVTVTGVQGTDVKFDIQVDQTPQ